jgi:hypothetical protein
LAGRITSNFDQAAAFVAPGINGSRIPLVHATARRARLTPNAALGPAGFSAPQLLAKTTQAGGCVVGAGLRRRSARR